MAKTKKLNAIAATVERLKSDRQVRTTGKYQLLAKRPPFEGMNKIYVPYKEEANDKTTKLPDESVKVQLRAVDIIKDIITSDSEMIDSIYHQDLGNQLAKVNVVNKAGDVIFSELPITFLMYLRKRIKEWHMCVNAIPVLDPSIEWTFDNVSNLYRSKQPVVKQRSLNEQVPIVKYPATDKHPAQTEMISKMVPVGDFVENRFSGAERADVKEELVKVAEDMLLAIDAAIQEANGQTQVDITKTISDKLFAYLTAPLTRVYAVK